MKKITILALFVCTGLQALQYGSRVSFCVQESVPVPNCFACDNIPKVSCLVQKGSGLEFTDDFYEGTQFFVVGPQSSGAVIPDNSVITLRPEKTFFLLAINPDGSLGLAKSGNTGFTVTPAGALRTTDKNKKLLTHNNETLVAYEAPKGNL